MMGVSVTEKSITTYEQFMKYWRAGTAARTTSSTKMNQVSSRSHSVVTIHVNQKDKHSGSSSWLRVASAKLVLVDLAGSELVGKSFLIGKQLEEAKMINKSLSTLGLVISTLTNKNAHPVHVPYRNSKLTRILQDSLGGTSRMALIMTVSPAAANANETLSTLRFGLRAKSLQNKVTKNVYTISTRQNNFFSPGRGRGNLNYLSPDQTIDDESLITNENYSRMEESYSTMKMKISLRNAEERLDIQSAEIVSLNEKLNNLQSLHMLSTISRVEATSEDSVLLDSAEVYELLEGQRGIV